jgi:CBS domain-containing protein
MGIAPDMAAEISQTEDRIMWRPDRDRPDDPRTRERETQRLARDEYDRPRYGSPPSGVGARMEPAWDRNAPGPHHSGGDSGAWSNDAPPGVFDRPAHEHPGAPAQDYGRPREVEDIRVHELMTRRVTNVHPATSVERAARLMEDCDCGALPVIGDNGVLIGMITDRDIAIRIVARGRDARNAIVADCMTERVFACYADESVTECMRQMALQQVRRMPIVDDRGRLVGIVAQSDLARHAGHHAVAHERRALTETVCAVSQPPHMPYR